MDNTSSSSVRFLQIVFMVVIYILVFNMMTAGLTVLLSFFFGVTTASVLVLVFNIYSIFKDYHKQVALVVANIVLETASDIRSVAKRALSFFKTKDSVAFAV